FSLTLLTDFLLYFIPNTLIGFFQYFSANFHFQNISKGLIDSRDILYFITISFIALYAANLVMKEKK
ncbi:MAG: ABC transporter, partial [Candidatus Aminicenantes bacterium]|nr:ABC transporter [Candidatus Aminicenantes bacterium]